MLVTLVNTVHAERGSATVPALVALLERLTPAVVFAEIPKANASRYIDGSHGNLESLAVASFRQRHPVTVVPVDRDEPQEEFFRVAREMFNLLERSSRDYRIVFDRHSEYTARGGLRYLNSSESVQALLDIHNEVRATIDWLRAPHLHAVYDTWLQEIELRDLEMIANITEFAVESEFTSSVFLVGAAHRQSIMHKVLSGPDSVRSRVEWQLELPSELFD